MNNKLELKFIISALTMSTMLLQMSFEISNYFGYLLKVLFVFIFVPLSIYSVYNGLRKFSNQRIIISTWILFNYIFFRAILDLSNFDFGAVYICVNLGVFVFAFNRTLTSQITEKILRLVYKQAFFLSLVLTTYHLFSRETTLDSGPSLIMIPTIILLFLCRWLTPKKLFIEGFVLLLLLLLSGKRSPLVIFLLASLIYLHSFRDIIQNRTMRVIIIGMLSIFIFGISSYFYAKSDIIRYRVENATSLENESRFFIGATIFDEFLGLDARGKLFGLGYRGVKNLLDIHAHSDWFQLLLNTGIIGVILYLIFIIKLLIAWLVSGGSKVYRMVGLILLVTLIFSSVTQALIYGPLGTILFFSIGHITADIYSHGEQV